MKKTMLVVIAGLMLMSTFVAAQTSTFTVTQDSCGAKNLGYCDLPVVDQFGTPFNIVLDHRNASSGPIDTLTLYDTNHTYPPMFTVHGTFAGFIGNPNGTRQAYFGAGSFESDGKTSDGKSQVEGRFWFYAYYVGICSGRGCAGSAVGWHFRLLGGSTVTVN